MLSGLCSNSNTRIPTFHTTKSPFSATLPPPSTCSFAQSHKRVSFRITPCTSLRALNRNTRAYCRNGAVQVVAAVATAEDSSSGLKRKKLAVFVSGGGSNFRSILEASLQGSILGDIVVLVTNKPGTLFLISSFFFSFNKEL